MKQIKWQNFDHDSRTYTVVINDFEDKMTSWDEERFISTKHFWIDSHPFSLNIQPNCENDHVGVFLQNEGEIDVIVSASFNIGSATLTLDSDTTIESKCGVGFRQLLPHNDIDIEDDEDLKVTVVVTKVEIKNLVLKKHMDYKFKASRNDVIGIEAKVVKLDHKLDDVSSDLQPGGRIESNMVEIVNNNKLQTIAAIKSKVDDLEKKLVTKEDFNRSIQTFGLRIAELEEKIVGKVERPKCENCSEGLKSNKPIRQCINGHLFCMGCANEQVSCDQCYMPINGRANGLESYLKSFFA